MKTTVLDEIGINGHRVVCDQHGMYSHGFYRASVVVDPGTDHAAVVGVYSSAAPDAHEDWLQNRWAYALHPEVIKRLSE